MVYYYVNKMIDFFSTQICIRIKMVTEVMWQNIINILMHYWLMNVFCTQSPVLKED